MVVNEKTKGEKIRSVAVTVMIVALSIGNIVNYRSITVYKVVSLLLPILFIYYKLRTKTKFHWNHFLLSWGFSF